MIIEKLLKLPAFVVDNGIVYRLVLWPIPGPNIEAYVPYAQFGYVNEEQSPVTIWLWQFRPVATDMEMMMAMDACREYLQQNNILAL